MSTTPNQTTIDGVTITRDQATKALAAMDRAQHLIYSMPVGTYMIPISMARRLNLLSNSMPPFKPRVSRAQFAAELQRSTADSGAWRPSGPSTLEHGFISAEHGFTPSGGDYVFGESIAGWITIAVTS